MKGEEVELGGDILSRYQNHRDLGNLDPSQGRHFGLNLWSARRDPQKRTIRG